MLADAVESASRALVEPTPARIESLVHDIAMQATARRPVRRVRSDACRKLHKVEDSLVKSLTAVYHGRVKYPEQVSSA